MDTGTAQGSALSQLLFILFINALLRLLDQSELHPLGQLSSCYEKVKAENA